MMGGAAVWAALLWAAAGMGAIAGLRVETGTPAALCPDVAEVRRAVQDRLNIEGQGEWLASYDLVHRPESEAGDIVRLELRDPAGRLRLERELPRSGASCVALAQAVALVLEAYFRHPGEARVEAGPAEAVQQTRPPVAHAEPTPPPTARGRGLAVALLGGGTAGPASPALALDLSYAGLNHWAVGVEGVWMTSEQTRGIDLEPGQGTGLLNSSLFHAWGALRWGAGRRVDLLVGPEVGLGIDRMRTLNVPEGRSNVRAAIGVGARGEVRIRLSARAALWFVAAADAFPRAWAGHFEVEGVSAEPFPPSAARLFLAAGFGVFAFP